MNKKILITIIVVILAAALLAFAYSAHQKSTVYQSPLPDTTSSSNSDSTPPTIPNPPATQTSNNAPVVTSNGKTVVTAKIGQQIEYLGAKATITSVTQDSRCAVGVQCIWAGTVVVLVHGTFGNLSKDFSLTLNQPTAYQGHSATLVSVTPEKKQGTIIAAGDYVFTIDVK